MHSLILSILVEPERTIAIEDRQTTNLNIFSIFLNCQGENAAFSTENIFQQDLDILFNHLSFKLPQEVEMFDFNIENDYEDFDQLIQMARANIQKIQANLLIDTFNIGHSRTYYTYRESVTKLLLLLRCSYQQLR